MKLYDLLSSTDTKPMDKIKRNIPEWENNFLLIPITSGSQLNCVNMMMSVMHLYTPSVIDILATDWIKF